MKCRNCGTEIADKALICYRCGTATAEPRIQPPPPTASRGPLPLIVAVLAIIAAAVVGLPYLEPGIMQMAGWAVVVVAVVIAVLGLKPQRRPRRR